MKLRWGRARTAAVADGFYQEHAFLAGDEIDPVSLRGPWKASLSIGVVSFALPFLAAFAFCALVLGWHRHAAEIGGVALSTTSVAVVYAVMVETGLSRHDLGKLILAACFVTDLGTVLALGGLFAGHRGQRRGGGPRRGGHLDHEALGRNLPPVSGRRARA